MSNAVLDTTYRTPRTIRDYQDMYDCAVAGNLNIFSRTATSTESKAFYLEPNLLEIEIKYFRDQVREAFDDCPLFRVCDHRPEWTPPPCGHCTRRNESDSEGNSVE